MFDKLVKFLATGLYSGLSPYAPGTAGTIVALLLLFIYPVQNISWPFFLLLIIFCFAVCRWYLNIFSIRGRKEIKDPKELVIDEMLGFWIAVFHITDIRTLLIIFLLFRLFDIFKPLFISKVEEWGGFLGVMADDLLAGLLARFIFEIVNIFI